MTTLDTQRADVPSYSTMMWNVRTSGVRLLVAADSAEAAIARVRMFLADRDPSMTLILSVECEPAFEFILT